MDASEIYSKKTQRERCDISQGKMRIYFSNRRWTNQPPWTSTLIRQRSIRGESHLDFLGESEGSLPQPQDALPVAGEAINIFLVHVSKLHIPPSR